MPVWISAEVLLKQTPEQYWSAQIIKSNVFYAQQVRSLMSAVAKMQSAQFSTNQCTLYHPKTEREPLETQNRSFYRAS